MRYTGVEKTQRRMKAIIAVSPSNQTKKSYGRRLAGDLQKKANL